MFELKKKRKFTCQIISCILGDGKIKIKRRPVFIAEEAFIRIGMLYLIYKIDRMRIVYKLLDNIVVSYEYVVVDV